MINPDYINIVFHCDTKTTFISRYHFETSHITFYGNDFNHTFCAGDHPDEYLEISKAKKWMMEITSKNTNKDDYLYVSHKMKGDEQWEKDSVDALACTFALNESSFNRLEANLVNNDVGFSKNIKFEISINKNELIKKSSKDNDFKLKVKEPSLLFKSKWGEDDYR